MSNHNGDPRPHEIEPEQLTAYTLGQLQGEELTAVKAKLAARGSESAQGDIREIQSLSAAVAAIRNSAESPARSPELRKALEDRLDQVNVVANANPKPSPRKPKATFLRIGLMEWMAIGGLA